MKTKLYLFITLISLTSIFTACSEEDVNPRDAKSGEVVAKGAGEDDTTF